MSLWSRLVRSSMREMKPSQHGTRSWHWGLTVNGLTSSLLGHLMLLCSCKDQKMVHQWSLTVICPILKVLRPSLDKPLSSLHRQRMRCDYCEGLVSSLGWHMSSLHSWWWRSLSWYTRATGIVQQILQITITCMCSKNWDASLLHQQIIKCLFHLLYTCIYMALWLVCNIYSVEAIHERHVMETLLVG